MPNHAAEQNRDDVLRYGEVVGCEIQTASKKLVTPEAARMEIDTNKIDEVVLALLYLTRCDDKFGSASWKGYDWDALNRLHEKGLIEDPVNKNKSVGLTEAGKDKSKELFFKLFGKSS